MITKLFRQMCCLSIVIAVVSCTSYAVFSQKAYEQATSLKVDALTLMDKAIEPYEQHKNEVDVFTLNIEKAYEYCRGLKNNTESIQQWEIIKDPERNSVIGFMIRWSEKKQLSKEFINDAKDLVSKGFDQIIELESGKSK